MTLKDFLPYMGEQKIADRLDKLQNKTMTYPVLIGIGFGKIVEQFVWYPEVEVNAVIRWTAFMVGMIIFYILSDEKQKKKDKEKEQREVEGEGKVESGN